MMAQINADSMKLCKRIESLLVKATRDSDGFYDFAQENEEIVKYAFLARAVVRGLIEPLPELLHQLLPSKKSSQSMQANLRMTMMRKRRTMSNV